MTTYGTIRKSLKSLSNSHRRSYFLLSVIQFVTSLLDLVAVAGIGVLSIAITTDKDGLRSNGVFFKLLNSLEVHFNDKSDLIATLAFLVVSLFVLKSIASLYFSRRLLHFLSARVAEISQDLFKRIFSQSILFIQKRSSQEVVAGLNGGVSAAIMVILGSACLMTAEIGLLLILGMGLFLVDPWLTLFSFFFFGLLIFTLQKSLSKVGILAGRERSLSEIQLTSVIQETISSFREIYIADRSAFTIEKFLKIRLRGIKSLSDAQWVALIPKYVMESALMVGAGLLAGYQFVKHDSITAFATLAVFLAAGSRILPSILRIQGSYSLLQNNIGTAEYYFQFIRDLEDEDKVQNIVSDASFSNYQSSTSPNVFNGSISLTSVYFTYPGRKNPTLANVNLEIPAGSSLAIVGSTGSGKSTLADLMLGVMNPQKGKILLGGVAPRDAMKLWPGKVGYVPQMVSLFNSTIRENIAIGRDISDIDDNKVWEVLEHCRLAEFFQSNPEGLMAQIGERGVKLSGGQRQRVGLARALYGEPELLVLDEATSALDAETEEAILGVIKSFSQKMTFVSIAHRLATVREVDNLIYLEKGRVIALGSFEDVRKMVPQFDKQARLLGL